MKNKEEIAYSRALIPKYNTLYKVIIWILIVIIIFLLAFYFIYVNVKNNDEDVSGDTITVNIYKEDVSPTREVGIPQMKIDYINNCSFSISYPEIGIEEIDESILEYARNLKRDFLNHYSSEDENAPLYSQHVDYQSYLDSGDTIRVVFIDCITNIEDVIISKKEYTHAYDLKTGNELGTYIKDVNDEADYSLIPLEDEDVSNFDLLYSGDIVKFATTDLNIRKEKDIKSEALDALYTGQAIEVRSGDGEWETVIYDGEIAYIKAGYLSRRRNLYKDVELEIKERGIDPSKPMVAITFDDGPNPVSTPRILDTLEQYGAVATFFDLGQLVNSYPDIVRREEKIGCEVGSHTYSHKNLNILSDEEIQNELYNSKIAFEKALGHDVTLFRPPYGNSNIKVKESWQYPIIKWNVDSLDWKTRNKTKILNQIYKTQNFDGKIILLHSIYGATADAVEELVPELINRGYQLVTVSELAYYKGNKFLKTATDYFGF